ncbi:hypothetical protein BDQ12DRAFT_713588 [Crucibulum laeve]|uniref:Uncharacterized protein n=1 Tax=Crucibulum laeve TaxID=68775 RepID=A0A5C3LYJ0_9AGAR|nr:hypothetical protein BDQ12DRAFT_713588 [Crucibulum laeve]
MKSVIITSAVVVASCALLTSAAPAGNAESHLAARASKGAGAAKAIGKAAEKWALNPSGQTDKDQRKKNREDAVKIVTGSGSGSATRARHPELQKAMNVISANNAFAAAGKKKKRSLDDEFEFEARDFDDFEYELVARASKAGGAAKAIGKAAEKWALNPSGQTDKDQRKKNREDAVKIVTGSGSGSATRARHPELQKAMNVISANNAFAAAGKKKKRSFDDEFEFEARDFDDFEYDLVARASKAGGAAKAIGKAAEKFMLNPQSMTDRDQRKKNRDDAIKIATGAGSGSATRNRHPALQRTMNVISASNAFAAAGKKKARSFDDEFEFEARDFDDFEYDLVARASKAGGAAKAIGKAAEKWALNPSSMTDRDQRKKNREDAVKIATGSGSGSATRNRHPELQKAMNVISATNAFSAAGKKKKRALYEDEFEAREFDEEFEARAFDDFEDDLFAREFYDLEELD